MSHEFEKDFSKFGKLFQEKLVKIMFYERPFFNQFMEVLNINFLEVKYLQKFVELMFDYKNEYGSHPTEDAMTMLMASSLDGENKVLDTQIRNFYARILSASGEESDAEYVKNTALDFCKKQKLREAMIKSAGLLKSSSFDEIASLVNDALKLGMSNDFGHDYVADFEERYKTSFRNQITTGWELIDKITKGGHGAGELGVVIAPTGAGKSMCLVHLATKALLEGKNVVYYTLELSEAVVGKRFDSCLTQVHLGDLELFKEDVKEQVLGNASLGNLIIKQYPTKKATTSTIKNHLEKVRSSGTDIEFVCVDYGDLLRSVSSYKEKRHELESIYEELRGLAVEFACPFWTASQTNRGALNQEVITMEAISEAYNKCFPADFIITISRTIEDKNKNAGKMFIAKNRNGPDGLIFELFMDTSNVTIEVLEPVETTIESTTTKATAERKTVLAAKYKKYLESKKEKVGN